MLTRLSCYDKFPKAGFGPGTAIAASLALYQSGTPTHEMLYHKYLLLI